MVARHQDDERLSVHDVVPGVVARLHAQEGEVQLTADECLGEIRRIAAIPLKVVLLGWAPLLVAEKHLQACRPIDLTLSGK